MANVENILERKHIVDYAKFVPLDYKHHRSVYLKIATTKNVLFEKDFIFRLFNLNIAMSKLSSKMLTNIT